MHLFSVNTSSPVNIEFNARTVTTGIYKTPRTGSVVLTRSGLEGDTIADTSVHGGSDQAIYLYHKEDYDWWSGQLGRPLEPGMFGENLTIAGMETIDWVIGDRIEINNVVLEITAPRTPCFKLGVRMGDSAFVKEPLIEYATPQA